MKDKDDIEMKDENPINPIWEASTQYNKLENIKNGTNIPDFIPLEDNTE